MRPTPVHTSTSTSSTEHSPFREEIEASLRSVHELIRKSYAPIPPPPFTPTATATTTKYGPANDHAFHDIRRSKFGFVNPFEPDVPQLQMKSFLADFTLTFGKFRGKKLFEVPTWYLQWLTIVTKTKDLAQTFASA